MYKLTLAAAAALIALTGTAATAQMDAARTTTTTQTMEHPMGTMEKTTTRTHTASSMHGTMPGHMAMKSKRHCKTWWSHGKKMRSCKMMKRHHM